MITPTPPMYNIKVTFTVVTPESAEQGDVAENGWENEEGLLWESEDEDGTPVEWAYGQLKDEVSGHSSSEFDPNGWWLGHEDTDYTTGAVKQLSYHLYGFDYDQKLELYNLLTK